MDLTSHILIVDDDLGICDALEALLQPEGYELAFANNGSEALARATECTPDLILLDVVMPGMDGFEVCQRVRSDPVLAEVPMDELEVQILVLGETASPLFEGVRGVVDDEDFGHAGSMRP